MLQEVFLSVIIPAYNEEKRLPKTIAATDLYLRKQPYHYEILVVNDGSTDKTVQVIQNLKSRIKNLMLVDNKENHGKGYVVRQGMLGAKGKYRLFTDADNSTSIDQVESMLSEFEKGYDVVIGSRDIKGAVLKPPQGLLRRFLGEVFRVLRKLIVGLWDIQDTQCGFKVFSAKAAADIFPRLKINRWAFDVEILAVARKLGYNIKEAPVVWVNDPHSKVKLSGMIKMLFEMAQIRWNLMKNIYK